MKKLLAMIGAVALITSGISTPIIVNTNIQVNMSETTHVSESWQTSVEGPRNLAEKVGGVWRLEFNHELTQDIVSGSANVSDILEIVSDAIGKIKGLGEKIGSISDIITAVLDLGKSVIDNADQGNGILIRFGGWVLPTKITASIHVWN